ncbi:MAG: hypothetical protein J7M40_06285 [Planctomycetes bacterium]|nr:hypothetical protein [Planctomycetota bacterium]
MKKAFLGIVISLLICQTGHCKTLRDVLVENRIDLPSAGVADEDLDVGVDLGRGGVCNSTDTFCFVCYPGADSEKLGDQLNVGVLNKHQNEWTSRRFDVKALVDAKPYSHMGSILGISCANNYIHVTTHRTPSACVTCIFTRDLEFVEALYGWPLASYSDGTMVYQKSQRHFAPTHYTEIGIYNPRTGADRKIYPLKPYQWPRREHIEKVRTVYEQLGVEWFARNNHHMDPELFNNSLRGDVMIDNDTRGLMFVIAFDNKDYWSQEEREKLSNFRYVRRDIKEYKIGRDVRGSFFRKLYMDLMIIRRSDSKKDSALSCFESDSQLYGMIRDALESEKQAGQSQQEYFVSLDENWESPGVWKRLRDRIALPAKHTKVVCIFRNIGTGQKIEYRTMLLNDFGRNCGSIKLSQCLQPEVLKKMFK